MKDLLPLLEQYDIAHPSAISRGIRVMGRPRLRDFLEDLIRFGKERGGAIARRPGELRVAAAGGSLSLGNAEDVLRELLLYADHVVFENPLPSLAERLIPKLETNVDELKDHLIAEIHPLLFQYLAMRPAWERGMSSFAYAADSNHREKHPLVALVKPTLLSNIRYTISDDGNYLVQMQVGSNSYAATRSFRAMNPSVIRAGPPYARSTRGMNRLEGVGFHMIVGGQPATDEHLADAASVLGDNHEAAPAIEEFVSYEIERIERLTRICIEAGASYVTDEPVDWSIVRSLSAVDQMAKPLQQEDVPSFVFNLASELSFLQSVSLDQLLELREEIEDDFLRFRGVILELGRSRSGSDPADWRRDAKRLVHEELEPSLGALSQRVRGAAKSHTDTVLGSLLAVVVTGMVAWASHSALPLLASLPLLSKVLQSADRYEASIEDPMFFLLKVREEASQPRNAMT